MTSLNEDYVKQFLRLLGYFMILYFIYQLKYIFFDLPNELKKWSADPKLRNIRNQLQSLDFNKTKILEELRSIKIKIEDMIGKKCIEEHTQEYLLGIIDHYIHLINTNQKKTKGSKDEIIQNLESLREVIEKFRIRDPFNY